MSEEILRSLGSIIENRSLYGPRHKVTIQSLEKAFDLLSHMLAAEASILFTIGPDECHINHKLIEARSPIIQHFVERMRGHEISTLTIKQGLAADEFIALMELIAQDPDTSAGNGGFAANLETDTFKHIESHKVTYVELTDDEVVIKKEESEEAERQRIERNASVMEYLGVIEEEPQPPTAAVATGMQALLETPTELGELIVKSAGESLQVSLPASSPMPIETIQNLITRIVKSLERTFDILKADKSSRSQKGKKALTKSLASLEADICNVIREVVTPIADSDLQPVSSAVEAMSDELAIDALASEYLRKRKLIEASETRLLRYMERHGDVIDTSDLKSRLLEGGLAPHNWDSLLISSGAKSIKSSLEGLANDIPGFKRLHEMLEQLSDSFHKADAANAPTRDEFKKLIAQVEARMDSLIDNTRKRMEMLEKQLADSNKDESSGTTDIAKQKSKAELLELIAEIVQELCQPLSVIQCSFDVLLTNSLPRVSPEKNDLLSLAAKSAKRLDLLIHDLSEIVGHPADLVPKERTKETMG